MIGLNRILVGDAAKSLRKLPAGSIDCVITSPPYFRLRNYQQAGQLGLEHQVEGWVSGLRKTLREVARVLVPTGSVWLNLGDTYSSGREGAPAKSLLLGPERLALALVEDGWIVRNKIVWAKSNPMPSAVRDRLSGTWEVIYLLVRSREYFFDLDAIRLPHRSSSKPAVRVAWSVPKGWRISPNGNTGLDRLRAEGRAGHPLGKNPGDVWFLATGAYRGAHHAVFPPWLVERPLLAGCPGRRCQRCRLPWKRPVVRHLGQLAVRGELQPTCACRAASEPGVVLDPFIGSGTTALVAERHGRNWLGIELNPKFARLAVERIAAGRTEPANGSETGRRAA